MGKHDKLVAKLRAKPKDFTYREAVSLLEGLGYQEATGGKTGGSRRRFKHPTAATIYLHKPHPRDILKPYQVRDILDTLEQEGLV